MENNTIRIVAAVVDTRQLTLYKEDGTTITIEQGDPRLRRILEEATPQLVATGSAIIHLEIPEDNQYAAFEKQSSGVVRFFKVAKAKLKEWWNGTPAEPVPEQAVGQVPTQAPGPVTQAIQTAMDVQQASVAQTSYDADLMVPIEAPMQDVGPATHHVLTAGIHNVSELDEAEAAEEWAAYQARMKKAVPANPWPFPDPTPAPSQAPEVAKAMSAVDEILKHAVPVSHADFHESSVDKQGNIREESGETDKQKTVNAEADQGKPDTIIAVVDNKIIPGMEKIKTQFARANKLGSTAAVENFLKRLGAVIKDRKHSIEDLLKFMERADTPIAEDGSIIIYKVLKRRFKNDKVIYVDCHTGKVEQWIGAYVCMDTSLVDQNRRNECSNGLHVARRGYIREFSGDVCVIAKLAPEDVIAVPEYDANKMRVCGYHIVHELSDTHYGYLKQNRPITEDEAGRKLLAAMIAGKHVGRTYEVRITEQKGGGVETKALVEDKPVRKAEPVIPVEALANPDQEMQVEQTDPKEVVKAVETAVEQVQLSRKEQAKILYDALAEGGQPALDAIHAFKKKCKVSWKELGLPEINGSVISIREDKPPKKAKHADKVKPSKASYKPVKTQPQVMHGVELEGEDRGRPGAEDDAVDTSDTGTPRERIAKLLAIGLGSVGVPGRILAIKKQAKKSWDVLGVTQAQVEEILKSTSK